MPEGAGEVRARGQGSKGIGIAVVGAGFMGGVHGSVLQLDPRASLRWVVDLDPGAGAELATQLGARATTTLDEALTDEAVQLVVVATPATTHEPIAARALHAGRHVLLEKPFALHVDAARRLATLARDRSSVLAYGGNFVYAPKFLRASQLAADTAALGVPHAVRVTFRTAGPDTGPLHTREMTGGVLADLGWHAIELCRWMLGKPAIEAVTACTQRVTAAGDVDEQGVMLLYFATGAVGQCDVSWLCPGGEQLTVEVLGTGGRVVADLWQGMGISAYTDAKFSEVWEPNQGWAFPEWEWIRNSGYEHQDRQVLDAMTGGPALAHTTEDALAILQALEAARHSAAEGRRIETHA